MTPPALLSCGMCIEDLDTPVALPCGHLFCNECIQRAIEAVEPYSTLHCCPMCQAPYSIATIDTASIPAYLRPHIQPSVRRLHPTTSTQEPRTISAPIEIAIENSRLHAENSALKTTCDMWRRRAEVHGAATLGLLGLSRSARDEAVKMRRERDEAYKYYELLRAKLPAEQNILCPYPPPASTCVELPPVPQTVIEAASLVPEDILAPSLSRRSQSCVVPSFMDINKSKLRSTKRARTG